MHAECGGSFISCNMYKQHNQSQALRYKHYLWQLIQYWWLNKLQGPNIHVYETCHLRHDNYDKKTVIIDTIDGSVTYVLATYS